MEATIYSKDGKKDGSISLPESVFGLKWNADLVHQVVVGMQANARVNVAHTKNRGEVSGGGKKPWKQKGTGRARHGSSRSPIWKGGGITHGPRNDKVFSKTIPAKMRAKALLIALSKKFNDGEILFVKDFGLTGPKAKDAKTALSTLAKIDGFDMLSTRRKNSALIAVPGSDKAVKLSFRNFGNVEVEEVRNLNPVDVLTHKYLVVTNPEEAIKLFESKAVAKKK